MSLPLLVSKTDQTKRFDTEHYVEGFATTFNAPYLLFESDGVKYYECIERGALLSADMTDVIMQYDHSGMIYARNNMGNGKPSTLIIEPQVEGLFIAADLSLTEDSRRLYEAISSGLVNKMSWAFRVSEDSYNKETRTRTIHKISKVYDVSAVSYPANIDTNIQARSILEFEKRNNESLRLKAKLLQLKTKL